jgi:hypothetical protein
MNPDDIVLESLTKNFEYVKYSREIDSINDSESLKDIAKSFYKLYLKQQEVVSNFNNKNNI